MPILPRRALTKYSLALLLVVVAIAITSVTPLATRSPMALCFAAVILSTWHGGRNAGFLAIALSLILGNYFILSPRFSFSFGYEALYPSVSFLILSSLTAWLMSSRRRIERSLEVSQNRYQTLFDYAPDGILIADSQSIYLDGNKSICRMLGYTQKELVGLRAKDILVEDEATHVREALDAIKRNDDHQREWRFMRKDGTVFPAEVIATMMPDGNIMAVVRDTSEREREEERFRQIIEGAPYGKVLVDPDGTIQLVNARIETQFGYERQELLGQSIEKLIPERFRSEHTALRNGFASNPAARPMGSGRELYGLRKDGSEFPLEIGLNPLKMRDGLMILGTVVDVTERRLAEEQNRRLHETLEFRVGERTAELAAANKELEAFSYSVSHDLRAPLRHINGFSNALLEDYSDKLDAVGKDYLNQLCGASEEMGRLIDDVLELARVARSEMRKQKVDLSELARSVLNEQKAMDPQRRVRIEIEPGLTAYGDQRLLGVVLMNLLGNAWKFTTGKPDPNIEFGASSSGESRAFYVRDNGAGFDMAYADKLYGAFQRLHSVKDFEGTGIGLATVQRIVHRHGGRVWAKGEVNKGATFYFSLPEIIQEDNEGQGDITG